MFPEDGSFPTSQCPDSSLLIDVVQQTEYWWFGSAGLAAAWIVISQVVGRPGGLRSSSIGCLRYSVIPAGAWGRVITAQTGDNYQSAAGSQLRRWEGPKPQDRKHHRCGRWMSVCNRDQLDHHTTRKLTRPPGNQQQMETLSMEVPPKKDRIHHVSSQHVEQNLSQKNLF